MIAGGIAGGDSNTNWTLTRCLVIGTINGRTTTEDGTPVLQLENEKALKVIYNENMSYEKGQGGLAIYIPTEKGYINYNFVHSVYADRNADMWRLTVANLANANGGIVKQITKDGAEWEMAVRIMDRPDFIGGYAHGDEIYSSLEVYVDGVKTEITSLKQCTTFTEMKILMDSVGYDPSDGTTKALDHHKEYTIHKDGIKLEQTVEWCKDYQMRKSSYLAMMPPVKYSVTNEEDIITDSCYTDLDETPKTISKTGGFSLTTEGVSSVCVYGEKSGVYFTMSKANYNQSKVGNSEMILSDNGGLNYNKMYFVYCGEDTEEAGEVWDSTTTYQIEWT